MRSLKKSATVGVIASAMFGVAGLIAAGPAAADGYCGQDYTSATACAVNSATTPNYGGSIIAGNDVDYYVFYASAGTKLETSITDTENAQCSENYSEYCGDVSVELYDAAGNDQGGPDN